MSSQRTKARLEDLAILGGVPAFSAPLHVGRPNIGDRERLLTRINDILDRKWLTNDGPYLLEFERRVADLIGAKHCVAMCNATIALEIAIRALGLSGEVLVPAFTFVATAHALQWQEITPVFVDVDPETHNIDPRSIEQLITPRVTGILGVHVFGRPCDVKALESIARRHNLRLLFDAAHAFGCSHRSRMIGGFGDAEVFSFHATKFLNAFEGGAVVTNNDDLAEKIRLTKNFGFSGYDRVVYIGTNGKMSEISAAMGLTSLESMERFIAVNYRNYKQYQCELARLPGVSMMAYDETERSNYQYIVLYIDETRSRISRDRLIEVLHAENILARRYFYPGCHRMQPYLSQRPQSASQLPITEGLVRRVVLLPTGTAVSTEEISAICSIIRLAVVQGSAVPAHEQLGRTQLSRQDGSVP
jgi:dTDP-4-amino-4,6-dideoxygalactose transaminase